MRSKIETDVVISGRPQWAEEVAAPRCLVLAEAELSREAPPGSGEARWSGAWPGGACRGAGGVASRLECGAGRWWAGAEEAEGGAPRRPLPPPRKHLTTKWTHS